MLSIYKQRIDRFSKKGIKFLKLGIQCTNWIEYFIQYNLCKTATLTKTETWF